jgi:hypothetical protein
MERQYKLSALALAALAATALGSAQAKTFSGATSDASGTLVQVGASTVNVPPIHNRDFAGIGVEGTGVASKVDFGGLSAYSGTGPVYQLAFPYDPASPHPDLGVFSFARAAAGEDVWYGEWSTDGSPNYSDRTVYYVGDKTNFSLPTSVTSATYAINGINQNAGSTTQTLTGSLNTSLGPTGGSFFGTLSGASFSINLGTAGSQIAVNSSGQFNDASGASIASTAVTGRVQGDFFGVNASSVAGIATFAGNSQYDTAFGGKK